MTGLKINKNPGFYHFQNLSSFGSNQIFSMGFNKSHWKCTKNMQLSPNFSNVNANEISLNKISKIFQAFCLTVNTFKTR